MAAYRVWCKGSRGSASRLGGAKSGVCAELSSFRHKIYIHMNEIDGKDDFVIRISEANTGKTLKEIRESL